MLTLIVLVSICVILVAVLAVVTKSKRTQEPPGPRGFPYFGQACAVSADSAHLKFSQWRKEYGDVYLFTMYGRKILILNDPMTIRKAFQEAELAGIVSDRPPSFMGHFIAENYKDVLFRRYDDVCQKLKAVTLEAMFNSGVGSELYQEIAAQEYKKYANVIASTNGSNTDIVKPIESSLCKLIGLLYYNYILSEPQAAHPTLVYDYLPIDGSQMSEKEDFTGKLLEDGDPVLKSIEDFDRYGNEMIMPATHLTLKVLPFLRYLPGRYGNLYRSLIRAREDMRKHLLRKTKEENQPNGRSGLLQALFTVQETEDWLTDDFILGVLMDLVNTSTLTSRGVISGFLFLLTHFQDMQRQICDEIDSNIEKSRCPRPEDLNNMPYTHACIKEVLRYQSHLGLTATHTNSKDIYIDGYFIPKDTAIYGNQWNVHHDERFWSDPWEFKPERFITETGQLIPFDSEILSRLFMPFGVGNRSCMGIKMTYDRMFMYITSILQRHVILPPSDTSLPSHDPRHLKPGTVLLAPDFVCRVLPR